MVVQDFTHQAKNRSIVVKENREVLAKVKKQMRHEESDLQINCVETFRLMYPKLRWLLFSVPNGGFRNSFEAARMVREGMSAGVLDIFICLPNKTYHGIFTDFKSERGRLSEYQIEFIKAVKAKGYLCLVIRSVEDFLREIENYLNDK
jgi:hypothetical protein